MLTGFPPVLAAQPQVLILGSMPGVASLDAVHYYAHPRNAMWPMLFAWFGQALPDSFEKRYKMACDHHIALWDVLKHCEREGSLDSAIDASTEVPNDIAALLKQTPSLKAVLLNGGKAAQAFKKYIQPQLTDWLGGVHTLPSTSPANARMSFDEKCEHWHQVLQQYLK